MAGKEYDDEDLGESLPVILSKGKVTPAPVEPTQKTGDAPVHERLQQAATAQERAEIYGSEYEKTLLNQMPSVDQLRAVDGQKSYHVIDGKNRLNLRANKVKVIHNFNGEAIEVDFVGYREGVLQNYLRETGRLPDPAIEKKKDLRSSAGYEED